MKKKKYARTHFEFFNKSDKIISMLYITQNIYENFKINERQDDETVSITKSSQIKTKLY